MNIENHNQSILPIVYIIILNYNGWADTIECLESLLRIDYPNYQIIVVDNHSADGSPGYLQAWAKGELDVWVNPARPLRRLSHPPVEKPLPYRVYHQRDIENNPSSFRIGIESGQTLSPRNPLIFIQAEENYGFTGGNNIGIKFALGQFADYVLLLNNDTVVTPSFLTELVRYEGKFSGSVITGGKIYYYDFPGRVWTAGGGWFIKFTGMARANLSENQEADGSRENRHLDFITGCLILVKRDI
ncbi:MAG: glycosyltransferase family 2 protein, partial [candidate division Zixibacteria bacterium]|nr:glycosyltransferase family 2 protein [candidate division Zixibacteria bacterium]